MAAQKTTFRARASLIDRLLDFNPRSQWEARPLRTLNRQEMRSVLRRDLGWLLNTRTPHPRHLFDDRDLTVIDYGIPDFGSYSPRNPDDRELLAKRIERAINAFEPRLQNVHVSVKPEMVNEKELRLVINAEMVIESVREPVSFLAAIQRETGAVEVDEDQ